MMFSVDPKTFKSQGQFAEVKVTLLDFRELLKISGNIVELQETSLVFVQFRRTLELGTA